MAHHRFATSQVRTGWQARRTGTASSVMHPARADQPLTVVRHACAGNKHQWRGSDAERPLDPGGTRQAKALADALADTSVRRLVASPTKRCIDTLGPLAACLRLEIELSDELAPGGSIERLVDDRCPSMPGTVLCTHGELMRRLLARLRAEHVPIHAEHGHDDWLLSKGSAWRLTVDADGDITELSHVAPLPLPDCAAHATSD